MKKALAVFGMLTLATTAGAQVMVHDQQAKAAAEQHLQVLTEKVAQGGLHVTFEAKPVTGAPYAGEAVTESIQMLADGNRIVRRTTARIYRDGAGRTRRETIGPDGQVMNVVISDPVRGTSVVFNPGENSAHRTSIATFVTTPDSGSSAVAGGGGAVVYYLTTGDKQQVELKKAQGVELKKAQEAELKAKQLAEQKAVQQHLEQQAVTAGVAGGVMTAGQAGAATWVSAGSGGGAAWSVSGYPSTKEELGEQAIEGVTAKGTRTTTTIPAGAIGNELPISITSEEWFSTDLKVLVMTKHADPRSGETTYRLMNIVRTEPNPSLFDLPAGVTVK